MRLPLLILHISAGVLAMLAGALAIGFRKGSRGHRMAGNVFVICMLSVSGLGAYLAFRKSEADNVLGGIFTFYLVATAWATARRGEAESWKLEWTTPPGCIGGGGRLVFLGSRGNAWPNGGRGPKFRRWILFLRCLGPVVRGRGRAHAAARAPFRRAAFSAASLAYVLRLVYRDNLLLPRAAAGVSHVAAEIARSCRIGFPSIAISDLLVYPSSLHQDLPKRMVGTWLGPIAVLTSGRKPYGGRERRQLLEDPAVGQLTINRQLTH
jgi:uncharacterized membrane protein